MPQKHFAEHDANTVVESSNSNKINYIYWLSVVISVVKSLFWLASLDQARATLVIR